MILITGTAHNATLLLLHSVLTHSIPLNALLQEHALQTVEDVFGTSSHQCLLARYAIQDITWITPTAVNH